MNAPVKTKDEIDGELSAGLTTIAVYFYTTLGCPLEYFNQMLADMTDNKAQQWIFYTNFKRLHPDLFA